MLTFLTIYQRYIFYLSSGLLGRISIWEEIRKYQGYVEEYQFEKREGNIKAVEKKGRDPQNSEKKINL